MNRHKYQHISRMMQRTAKGYCDNGITGLAQVMRKNPNILSNKLNPECDANSLTLEEAAEIIDLTGDHAVVDTLASLVNRVTVSLPYVEIGASQLMSEFIRITQETGKLGEEILDAEHPDGDWGDKISPSEKKRLIAQAKLVIQAGLTLIKGLES